METPRSSAPEKARPAGGPPKPIDAVLAEFARRLGADRYDVWFRNAARVDLAEDGVIEVRVPNSFIGRFLEERCAALLRACGAQVLGVEPQARFVVDGDTFPARPPSAAGAAAAEPSRPAARANAGRSRMLAGTAQGRRFSLAEFVVGPGTRMAHAAALRVAESPGKAFNPLFIHGKVGLGKTHLLLGIAAALAERRPELETLYTSAEEFTNVFLAAMKAGALDRFRREVRSLDVLILDDIHFFSKKHATQEEFLHTFNSIEAEGRQSSARAW
jgi:chromosomal replication initiator protein